jgi:hypothetical protein
MANPREENRNHQSAEDAAKRTGERVVDQTTRFGRVAAETGEDMVRASANLLQQNAETLQNFWRFGLDVPSGVMGRAADQIGQTLGVSGDDAQRAAEHSAGNAEMILHSTTAVSKMMAEMSREHFDFWRHQIENSMGRMNDLWRCRTPQDLIAVHSDLVRESMGAFLESSRRVADMSVKMVDDTRKQINQTAERRNRAA